MADQLTNFFLADIVTLRQYNTDVMTGGERVGKDIIAMMADYLQREIHIFMYVNVGDTSTKKYLLISSATDQHSLIAFYEPGTIAVRRSVSRLQHAH